MEKIGFAREEMQYEGLSEILVISKRQKERQGHSLTSLKLYSL